MKIEFSSLEEVRKFVEQVFGGACRSPQIEGRIERPSPLFAEPEVVDAEIVHATPEPYTPGAVLGAESEKPARKRRADAGQPRGPYKTTGEPVAGEAQRPDGVKASAVPATPTINAAPAGAAPTLADARAALKRISDTKGLGAEACIEHLKQHGAQMISKLPEAMYAAFIAGADAKVAAAQPAMAVK